MTVHCARNLLLEHLVQCQNEKQCQIRFNIGYQLNFKLNIYFNNLTSKWIETAKVHILKTQEVDSLHLYGWDLELLFSKDNINLLFI